MTLPHKFQHKFTHRSVIALLIAGLLFGACGGSAASIPIDTGGSDPSPKGTVTVQLEEVEGIFVEGFEIGLRFETADGDVIDSTLWTNFVADLGDQAPERFYDAVLSQQVPAGSVVVFATVNVGIGPPPEVPDLSGEMQCRLDITVGESQVVAVEVDFSGTSDCLQTL